jgi:hypothetical protein
MVIKLRRSLKLQVKNILTNKVTELINKLRDHSYINNLYHDKM